MVIEIIRFKSELPAEEVWQRYQARSDRYRRVPGLLQKYYLAFRESPEHGAVYVWDSDESLRRFRKSELAGTIPSIYRIQGTADIHDADVVLELWPHVASELHQRDQENRPNR